MSAATAKETLGFHGTTTIKPTKPPSMAAPLKAANKTAHKPKGTGWLATAIQLAREFGATALTTRPSMRGGASSAR